MDRYRLRDMAWGYLGSCIPFVASLGLVLGRRRPGNLHGTGHGRRVRAQCRLVAAGDPAAAEALPAGTRFGAPGISVRESFLRLGKVLGDIRQNRKVMWVSAGVFLLHRRRVHHHRYGHVLWKRHWTEQRRAAAGASDDPDRGVSLCPAVWKGGKEIQKHDADPSVHRLLFLPLPCLRCSWTSSGNSGFWRLA